jgi:hypothetical protein
MPLLALGLSTGKYMALLTHEPYKTFRREKSRRN